MIQTISTPPADAESIDSAHALLSDALRRAAVEVLAERPPPLAVTDLAGAIAEGDADRTSRDIAISLHHVHLPKLDQGDVIEYDPATKTVTATNRDVLRSFVEWHAVGE